MDRHTSCCHSAPSHWILAGLVALGGVALAVAVARAVSRQRHFLAPPHAGLHVQASHLIASDGALEASETTGERGYRERLSALRSRATTSGRITYAEVILAAYGEGVIDRRVLALKSHYRRRLPAPHRFVTDYRNLEKVSMVSEGRRVFDPLTKGQVEGMYDDHESRVILTRGGGDSTLPHEVAHGLQSGRTSAMDGFGDRRTYRAMKAGRLTDSEERVLRYITMSGEFEIALQDLNRFHALATGKGPIMDELGSIAALARFVPGLEIDEVSAAFALERRKIARNEIAQALRTIPVGIPTTSLFRDARRFRWMRERALRVDRDYWIALLNRAIFEAPGHL